MPSYICLVCVYSVSFPVISPLSVVYLCRQADGRQQGQSQQSQQQSQQQRCRRTMPGRPLPAAALHSPLTARPAPGDDASSGYGSPDSVTMETTR